MPRLVHRGEQYPPSLLDVEEAARGHAVKLAEARQFVPRRGCVSVLLAAQGLVGYAGILPHVFQSVPRASYLPQASAYGLSRDPEHSNSRLLPNSRIRERHAVTVGLGDVLSLL